MIKKYHTSLICLNAYYCPVPRLLLIINNYFDLKNIKQSSSVNLKILLNRDKLFLRAIFIKICLHPS